MTRLCQQAIVVVLVLALGACTSTNAFVDMRPDNEGNAFAVAWLEFTRPDDSHVTLVNMAHFGHVDFYDRVSKSLNNYDIVLMEGVTGERKTPSEVMSHYREIAETLGVTTQESALAPQSNWRVSDVDAGTIAAAIGDIEAEIGSFNELLKSRLQEEIAFSKAKWPALNEAEHKAKAQESLRQSFAEGLTESTVDSDPIIIVARNRFLLARLDDYLGSKDSVGARNVAICWGVAHAPDLVERLKNDGWILTSIEWQPVFPIAP
ncbi:MAG: hypothetical protein ACI97A_000065 [Planctomycetota bacterium]|jgi:hypothetical protein